MFQVGSWGLGAKKNSDNELPPCVNKDENEKNKPAEHADPLLNAPPNSGWYLITGVPFSDFHSLTPGTR
jgi:hypothetical protein